MCVFCLLIGLLTLMLAAFPDDAPELPRFPGWADFVGLRVGGILGEWDPCDLARSSPGRSPRRPRGDWARLIVPDRTERLGRRWLLLRAKLRRLPLSDSVQDNTQKPSNEYKTGNTVVHVRNLAVLCLQTLSCQAHKMQSSNRTMNDRKFVFVSSLVCVNIHHNSINNHVDISITWEGKTKEANSIQLSLKMMAPLMLSCLARYSLCISRQLCEVQMLFSGPTMLRCRKPEAFSSCAGYNELLKLSRGWPCWWIGEICPFTINMGIYARNNFVAI